MNTLVYIPRIERSASVFEVQKAGYKIINEVKHDVDAIGMFTGTKES